MKQKYLPYVDPLTFDIYTVEQQFNMLGSNDPFSNCPNILRDTIAILNDTSIISPEERRIFYLYAEVGSARRASDFCGKRKHLITGAIRNVKEKVYKRLEQLGYKLSSPQRDDIYYKSPTNPDELIIEEENITTLEDEWSSILSNGRYGHRVHC